MVTVTVRAGAVFYDHMNGLVYNAGETVSVSGFDAERGKYYSVFV